ncbi:MAG: DUF1059 domain-containing protein [Candidatus Micrarchaeota archaeon]|nr:DUF1059 domain-containing protein [Candidatus Micrarchaeota archaeon]
MAKSFACKDMGMQCGFEVKSDNEDEVLEYAQLHAQKAHNIQSIDAAMVAKLKGAMKDVPSAAGTQPSAPAAAPSGATAPAGTPPTA